MLSVWVPFHSINNDAQNFRLFGRLLWKNLKCLEESSKEESDSSSLSFYLLSATNWDFKMATIQEPCLCIRSIVLRKYPLSCVSPTMLAHQGMRPSVLGMPIQNEPHSSHSFQCHFHLSEWLDSWTVVLFIQLRKNQVIHLLTTTLRDCMRNPQSFLSARPEASLFMTILLSVGNPSKSNRF
jgi:hypothetical protein